MQHQNDHDNVTNLHEARPRDKSAERSLLHSAFTAECLKVHVPNYGIFKTDTGKTLIEVMPDGLVQTREEDDLFAVIAKAAIGRMPRSEVRREVLGAVLDGLPRIRPAEVAPYVFLSDRTNRFAWQRLSFDRNDSAKCPEPWAKVLANITTDKARQSLVLWVGSLLDYDFSRVQYLYMHGLGGEGKSLTAAALSKVFSGQGTTPITASMLENRFGMALVMGKRLVQFNDENNPRFPSSGAFKRLTGEGDLVVERKGKDPIVVPAIHKVMVSSNTPIDSTNLKADKRRILPTLWRREGSDPDAALEAWVHATAPQFVQWCYSEFVSWKESSKLGAIQMCQETYNYFDSTSEAALTSDDLEGIIAPDPDGRILLKDLSKVIRNRMNLKRGDNQRLKKYLDQLTAQYGLDRIANDGVRYIKGARLLVRPPIDPDSTSENLT